MDIPRPLTLAAATLLAVAAHAAPCDAPERRQFDFWLGEWNVHTPDGKLAGTNRIERGYDGCVLHERYSTERGFRGESLNAWDAGRRLWHQKWVDNQGTLLLLEGGLRGADMVLEGRVTGADGKVIEHRITWSPQPGGAVRQHWQTRGAGADWQTAFDGRYTRR